MPVSPTVEAFLQGHQAPYETERHALALSSLETARVARIDEDHLAKSVLLEDDAGPLLAVLPASMRLELARVRDEFGRSLSLVPERDTARFFPDCAPGALPALGPAYGLPTLIDRNLESLSDVYFEAGDHQTLIRVRGDVFLDLLKNAMRGEIGREVDACSGGFADREHLYRSILSLSDAITAPLGRGVRWRHRVRSELERLRSGLADHVAETEAPLGLLGEIEEHAPHLARKVDRLRAEHTSLEIDCRRALEGVDQLQSLESVRARVLVLLGKFARHRHRGADLVYEAFGIDIGGG